jgi:hypothetical protein
LELVKNLLLLVILVMRRNQIPRPSTVGSTMSTLYNSASRFSTFAGEYSEPARFSRCLSVTSSA